MFVRAFVTMVAADALDRRMRERQYRAWAAEHARLQRAAHARAEPGAQGEEPPYDGSRPPARPT